MTLHQRIAEHLGWPIEEVKTLSLAALRDLVVDQGIKDDISEVLAKGSHLPGEDLIENVRKARK